MLSDIQLVQAFLANEGIYYRDVTDVSIFMKASGGKLNPEHAMGIQPLNFDVILFDVYQTVDWIRSEGLRRV